MSKFIKFFNELGIQDVPQVGGKNASLGEMYCKLTGKGVLIPNGFATTAYAYNYFLEKSGLKQEIRDILKTLDTKNVTNLMKHGDLVRKAIIRAEFPEDLAEEIRISYKKLSDKYGVKNVDVAVRSSATAEDLPDASFAGQQETFLNVSGEKDIIKAVRKCIASLFTNRAISYREDKGFDHFDIALSVGIQKMVRSDIASSGVMFSIDTESGFKNAVLINSIYGLGENIVQGKVNPDEFYVFKPTSAIISRSIGKKRLRMVYNNAKNATKPVKDIKVSTAEQDKQSITDKQVKELAKWAMIIEDHYKKPMDMEWALDGRDNKLYITQARPETVQSMRDYNVVEKYKLEKRGRTCHAAIISREMGIPCVVGTNDGSRKVKAGTKVTVSCAEGEEGFIYEGIQPFKVTKTNIKNLKRPKTKIMMNVGEPDQAFSDSFIPNDGVGLARMEFIINNYIKAHPLALINFSKLKDQKIKKEISEITKGYSDKKQFFIDKMAEGVATIAAAFYPKDVIIRLSDFKSNEYANLLGGRDYEPTESNPMIGWRGASRYYSPKFLPAFELECKALAKVRDKMGLTNLKIMIPFCRTVEEGIRVKEIMAKHNLKRGKNGLEIYVMAEIPTNIVLAHEFAKEFDGFSIGSNDLTQLTLGIDRDAGGTLEVAGVSNEKNEAVRTLIKYLIQVGKETKTKVGICGPAPPHFPDFATFLVGCGIDSISLIPDTVIKTTIAVNKKEASLKSKKK